MKKRTFLIAITLMSFILLLVFGLSASGGSAAENEDSFVYLPVITDSSALLFSDDFSNPDSGWPVGDDSIVQRSYQDGEYETLIRQADWWAGALAPVDGLTAYNVRASMRRLQGSTSDYGLVFSWQNWGNFYYLIVDPGDVVDPNDLWFGVARVVNGVPSIVIPKTNTTVIQPGNATNRLRVDRNGTEIAVSINGIRLATAQEKGIANGARVGFYMEADDAAPAIVRYDDFEVWLPENGTGQNALTKLTETDFASGAGFSAVLDWEQ